MLISIRHFDLFLHLFLKFSILECLAKVIFGIGFIICCRSCRFCSLLRLGLSVSVLRVSSLPGFGLGCLGLRPLITGRLGSRALIFILSSGSQHGQEYLPNLANTSILYTYNALKQSALVLWFPSIFTLLVYPDTDLMNSLVWYLLVQAGDQLM